MNKADMNVNLGTVTLYFPIVSWPKKFSGSPNKGDGFIMSESPQVKQKLKASEKD